MAGQFAPGNHSLRPDFNAMFLLARRKYRNAESIFIAIADQLARISVMLLAVTTLLFRCPCHWRGNARNARRSGHSRARSRGWTNAAPREIRAHRFHDALENLAGGSGPSLAYLGLWPVKMEADVDVRFK